MSLGSASSSERPLDVEDVSQLVEEELAGCSDLGHSRLLFMG